MQMLREQPGKVESHTIFQIPVDQRHGRARDLFTIWFGTNIQLLTIVTGGLATTVFKLSYAAALLALVVGNLTGGVFMALHAAQGPRLGVPQMVQTRGQFGSMGAVLVVGIVIIMYVGFLASTIVLAGESLHLILPRIGEHPMIVLIAIVTLITTIYGHDLIHAYARLFTWASGIALLVAFGWITLIHGLPAGFAQLGVYSTAGFCSVVSVAALWQIAYAPYVSDYTRYMPQATGATPAFWASYWGCTLGSILPMALGALLGLIAADGDITRALIRDTGPLSAPIIIVLSVGIAGNAAVNLYCGVLSTITLVQTFIPNWRAGSLARTVTSVILLGVALALALFAASNFLAAYTDFILLLLYVLVPWTAVNLVDYYLVRHGDYDVSDFFSPEGGIYGRFNRSAILCYLLGIAVQLPFVDTTLYTGPVARMLGNVDLSWVVGLAVVGPVYYGMVRRGQAAVIGADIAQQRA
jgi:NCS1 family nucleobase:cation symporter-1